MAVTIDTIRTLIQDKETPPILSDADIQVFLNLEVNAYRAAADAARSISAKFADRVDMGSGSSRLALSKQSQAYITIANALDKRAQGGAGGGTGVVGLVTGAPILTGISKGEMATERSNPDRFNGVFHRGQMSNPPGSDPANDYATDYQDS